MPLKTMFRIPRESKSTLRCQGASPAKCHPELKTSLLCCSHSSLSWEQSHTELSGAQHDLYVSKDGTNNCFWDKSNCSVSRGKSGDKQRVESGYQEHKAGLEMAEGRYRAHRTQEWWCPVEQKGNQGNGKCFKTARTKSTWALPKQA